MFGNAALVLAERSVEAVEEGPDCIERHTTFTCLDQCLSRHTWNQLDIAHFCQSLVRHADRCLIVGRPVLFIAEPIRGDVFYLASQERYPSLIVGKKMNLRLKSRMHEVDIFRPDVCRYDKAALAWHKI